MKTEIRFLVGQSDLLGDKEIAVQIRGNSHYRNSCENASQVGMLIALCVARGLLGKTERLRQSLGVAGRGGVLSAVLSVESTFVLSFCKKRKDRKS